MNPMSLDAEDELVHPVPVQSLTVPMSEVDAQRAKRARVAVRRFRQGHRYFRLYNSRGPRVEVLSIEAKKGKAVVDGKRGVYVVVLCDLLPSA